MITVSVEYSKQSIVRIVISGHAGYDRFGKDLVCASISSISYGLMNAVDMMAEGDCIIRDDKNLSSITVINNSVKLQNILQTGLIMMKTVQESYPKFVKINSMEVKQ